MTKRAEVINLVRSLSLTDQLKIVEEILRIMREESEQRDVPQRVSPAQPSILDLAGVIDDQEAAVMEGAVDESRKIDRNEW